MMALEWIHLAMFVGGVAVHYAYNRYVSPTPQTPSLTMDAINILSGLVHKLIDHQAPMPIIPPPPADTTQELLALLHKLLEQKGLPASPAIVPPTTNL